MTKLSFCAFVIACILVSPVALAQTRSFSYQGEIRTPAGNAVPDGKYTIAVRLYDTSTGGVALYAEAHDAEVTHGVFNLLIGSIIPFPSQLEFDRELFLGITIGEDAELAPRTKIVPAPSALYAARAGEAMSISPDALGVITSLNELTGSVRIIGDSTLIVNQSGNTIALHAIARQNAGIGLLTSPEKTLMIQSPSGPIAILDVADGAITTTKLADASVTGSKIAQLGASNGQVLKWSGTVWTPGNDLGGLQIVSVNQPLTGDGTLINPISISPASGTTNGYLSAVDWTSFNSKLSTAAVTLRLIGNGTVGSPLDLAQQGATIGQALKWNGATWSPANDLTGLTGISVRSPELTGSGISADPVVLSQQGATSGQVLKWNGTSWSPAADNGLATVAVSAPLTGNGTTGSPISISQANGSTNGYLSSSDWATFNTKLSSVVVTARLSGNGTTANPLDIAQQGATSGQVLKWNGTSWSPAADNGLSTVSVRSPELAGSGTTADPISLSQQGATSGQVLKWNGTSWSPATDAGLATVAVNSPLTGNGTTGSPISIPQANGSTNGYLSSTDWAIFNNKLSTVAVTARLTGNGATANPLDIAQQGATSGQSLKWNGSAWAPANDNGLTTVSVTAPITGNGTPANPLAMAQANGSTNGYLSSGDWTTFNNKLSLVIVTARLAGNGTTANPLDIAQQGAASGQVLKWNGTTWSPSNDADGLSSVAVTARLTGDGTTGNPLDIAQQGAITGQVLRWNGASWSPGAGGLTSVSTTAPITGDGTSANPLAIAQANGSTNGYLSSSDWTTFNNKLSSVAVTARLTGNGTTGNPLEIAQQGATNGQALKWNGSNWSPANDNGGLSTVSVNAPIAGNGTSGNPLSIAQADGSTNGYLTSTDWTTFNTKLSSVAVTARLIGNGTTASPLDIAQQGATSGQVLKWNGSAWSPSNDNTGALANGTATNSTLRWDGSNWVENANVLSSAAGQVTVNAGVNLNGSSSPLQANGSAGTSGYVLASQGAGNTPSWQDVSGLIAAWKLSGNALTGGSSSSPTEFFGSTNAYDVIWRANNTERMRIVSAGNVGIGTSNPSEAQLVTSSTFPGGATHRHSGLFLGLYPSGMSDGGTPYNALESRMYVQNNSNLNLIDGSMVAITSLQGTSTSAARAFIGVIDINSSSAATHNNVEGILGRIYISTTASGTTTLTEARGLRSDFWLQSNAVTIQNGYGVYVDAPTFSAGVNASALNNFTGLHFENLNVGSGTRRVIYYDGTGSNAPFVLTDLGRVGIGQITPQELLDVKGNVRLTSNSGSAQQLQFQNPAGTFQSTLAAGAQTASINYTLPTAQPSTNQVLTATGVTGSGPYNITLGWQNAASSAWSLTGNIGTTAGTNFLGTTDNQAFEIKVNNSRALRIEPQSSPNVIAGFSANAITTGKVGSAIGGGGATGAAHTINGDFSFIGGGYGNTITTSYATIGGGTANSASGIHATVAGGDLNIASGEKSGVAAGFENVATAIFTFVGGGYTNEASAEAATVGGGRQNYAAATYSTVGGGSGNVISTSAGDYSTIGGGGGNSVSGQYSTIAGGNGNTITQTQSGILGGRSNTITGAYDAIIGGREMTLSGNRSFGFNANNASFTLPMSVSANDVGVFGNTDIWLANNDNAASQLRFYEANNQAGGGSFPPSGVNYTSLQAGAQTADISYTLPTAVPPQNGALMTSTTGGAMSWSSNLAWDATNSRLAVNTTSANTKVDINGDIALRENSVSLANGNNNNVSVGNYSFIRITGPTANFTITGISGGQNGRMLIVFNNSGQQMTINHNDNTNSAAANVILTRNGAAYSTPGGSNFDVVTMIYSAANSAWIITSVY